MSELGVYTAIIGWTVPSNAKAGDNVHVEVQIQNLGYSTIGVALSVAGALGYNDDYIPWDEKNLPSWDNDAFSADFPMPSSDVNLILRSMVWGDSGYFEDARVLASITLGVTPPPGWQKLAETSVAVQLTTPQPPTPVWLKLAELQLTVPLAPVQPVVWQKLDEKSVGVPVETGVPVPTDYKLIRQNIYPEGEKYSGPAEQCSYFFKVLLPNEIPGQTWMAQQVIDAFQNKVKENGGEILSLEIYENNVPVLWTEYLIVAAARPVSVPYARALIHIPWGVVMGVLAIILAITIIFMLIQVKEIIWGPPGKASPLTTFLIISGIGLGAFVLIKASSKKTLAKV